MAPARNRTIALIVTLLVAAAGCSRAGSEPGPTAPLVTAGPSEAPSAEPTETASPDPYAIPEDPEDIDAAYVERVLEALSVGYAEATREVATSRRVTPAVRRILQNTHTDEAAGSVVSDFRRVLRSPGGRSAFSPSPKPAEIQVREIVSRTRSCLFALVRQDLSGLLRQGSRPFLSYYYLVAEGDSQGVNRTPWKIAGNAEPLRGGADFKDPC